MTSWRRYGALAVALHAVLLHAQAPAIREIAFEGNDTTQPRTMLREIAIQPGDPADAAAIERARQAILDLGLFRGVKVRQETFADGDVRVVFTVNEKWYILPIPRLDANSDKQFGYGAALRWANVWGLNHTLRATWSRKDFQVEDRGVTTSFGAGYFIPLLLDTPWNLSLSAGHTETPVTEPPGYDESFDDVQILLTRNFARGAASQGWNLGGGLLWQNEQTDGEFAKPAYGMATSLVGLAGFRDVRFKVYSEEGRQFNSRYEIAVEGAGSDYDSSRFTASYRQFWAVGETRHQTAHVITGFGTLNGGPPDYDGFALGGAGDLRGYEKDFSRGDAYYLVAGEFLRPVFRDSIRLLLVAEVGRTFRDLSDANLDKTFASVGIGVRLRFSQFVNFEVEAGFAYPLIDGEEVRFFAGGV